MANKMQITGWMLSGVENPRIRFKRIQKTGTPVYYGVYHFKDDAWLGCHQMLSEMEDVGGLADPRKRGSASGPLFVEVLTAKGSVAHSTTITHEAFELMRRRLQFRKQKD
jgi:hypothetical protein